MGIQFVIERAVDEVENWLLGSPEEDKEAYERVTELIKEHRVILVHNYHATLEIIIFKD
jgi:hypothetical protein